jgi:hypothetical protein
MRIIQSDGYLVRFAEKQEMYLNAYPVSFILRCGFKENRSEQYHTTVSWHTGRCLMAFEEVVAVPPTPEEAEDETDGDGDIEMFMEDCGEALLFGLSS